MKKFNAFTLAEVLITLGIIGVVAAMTMPTLINQTNGAQYKAAYKKALSAIAQGVTLNVALDGGSFADTVANTTGGTVDKVSGADTVASILNARMNVVKASTYAAKGYDITGDIATGKHTCTAAEVTDSASACNGKTAGDTIATGSFTPNTSLFFNDGSVFSFDSTKAACSKDSNVSGAAICYGVIDVNGAKGPNKVVTCDNGTNDDTCTANNPTDVYIVEFYDQTILPASPASKAVLYGK